MANEELKNTERSNSESEWDKLKKGPEESSESEGDITAKDVEYFKENPKELSDLVAELIQLRGGDKAIKEGATWDKDMRAYVGDDGLPRDWAHLTGYLKNNPDAIGGILQEYNDLHNLAEDEAVSKDKMRELVRKYPRLPGEKTAEWKVRIDAEEAKDGGVPAEESVMEEVKYEDAAAGGGMSETAVVEAPMEQAVEEAAEAEEANDAEESAEIEEAVESEAAAKVETEEVAEEAKEETGKIIEFPGPKKAEKTPVSFEEQMGALNERIDGIRRMQEQSAVWEAMAKVLDASAPSVQAQVKYLRAKESLERDQKALEERKAALRKMPLITLPWSKKRQEKIVLKQTIASSEKSFAYNSEKLQELETDLPESVTEEEQEKIDAFRAMDARMARLNADLHTRGLEKDIKMRETWISQQEEMLKHDNKNTINAPSDKARHEAIARWREEISEIQGRIAKYQAEHPDFEMHPQEKKQEELPEAA